MNNLRLRLALAAAAALTACAVGPDYHRPDTVAGAAIDAHFVNAGEAGLSEEPAAERFWTVFKDPLLSQLVADALAANDDLKIAAANLRASRALRRVTGFDQYPTITSGAGYTHSLQSQHQLPGVDRSSREADTVDAGFDALWELDLFGRVRRGVEAARADEGASLATLQDVQVSVTAELTRDYCALRGLQEQLGVARRNADNQNRSLDITLTRLKAGRGNELDSSRADAQLKTTMANIPSLEAAIAKAIYRISVLTGRPPDALRPQLAPPQAIPELPALNAIGTPETLLRRRPDIRVAERNLAAATARIGVAVGDLFPKVTFVGSIGLNAGSGSGLGDAGAETFAFGPSLSWAAFDLGRVRARIDASKARTEAALANYEKVVLGALEETEGAVITYGRAQARRDTLAQAAAASAKAASLARQRFEGGLTDFINVLDAERSTLESESLLAQSRTDAATSLIAVYKALGGAWSIDGPVPPTATGSAP